MQTWVATICWVLGSRLAARAGIGVVVSVIPQAQLVERLGGERVEVSVLVQAGHSPATYEPTARQLAQLGKSRLYVRVGAPFERGIIEKIRSNYPGLMLIDQRKGVPLLYKSGRRLGAQTGHPEAADHHIWLDPKRLKIQAATLADALISVDPQGEANYRCGLERLLKDLEALDRRITARLAPFRGRSILVHHPAYGYFADSYGLAQVAVESDGKEPGVRRMATLIEKARRAGVKAVFVQPQLSDKSARLIADRVGGTLVVMDPLASDLLANLEDMAEKIATALDKEDR